MAKASITESTMIILALTLLGSAVGFVSQIITAHYFGASKDLDAFVVASIVPFMIFGITNASLMSSLVYTFTNQKWKNNKEQDTVKSGIINTTILALITVCTLLIIISPVLAKVIAPGFSEEQLNLTSKMIKILSIAIFFMGVSSVLSGLLYIKAKFTTSCLLRTLIGLCTILFVIFFNNNYSIYTLAAGLTIGTAITTIIQFIDLRKNTKISLELNLLNPKKIYKELFINSWPIVLTSLIYYSNKTINNIFASLLSVGSISVLNYAFNIASFAPVLVSTAISTTTFPHLVEKCKKNNLKEFEQLLTKSIITLILILLPTAIFMFIFRQDLITLLLQRGKFDSADTARTTAALGYYLFGIIALAIYPLLSNTLIAIGRPLKSALLMLSLLFFNLMLNFILQKYSITGLAFASSLSQWVSCVIGVLIIRKEITIFKITNVLKKTAKITLTILPAIITLHTIRTSTNNKYIILISILLSLFTYLFFLKSLNVKEYHYLKNKILA